MAVRHTLEIRLFQNPAAASVRKFFRIINPAVNLSILHSF